MDEKLFFRLVLSASHDDSEITRRDAATVDRHCDGVAVGANRVSDDGVAASCLKDLNHYVGGAEVVGYGGGAGGSERWRGRTVLRGNSGQR